MSPHGGGSLLLINTNTRYRWTVLLIMAAPEGIKEKTKRTPHTKKWWARLGRAHRLSFLGIVLEKMAKWLVMDRMINSVGLYPYSRATSKWASRTYHHSDTTWRQHCCLVCVVSIKCHKMVTRKMQIVFSQNHQDDCFVLSKHQRHLVHRGAKTRENIRVEGAEIREFSGGNFRKKTRPNSCRLI